MGTGQQIAKGGGEVERESRWERGGAAENGGGEEAVEHATVACGPLPLNQLPAITGSPSIDGSVETLECGASDLVHQPSERGLEQMMMDAQVKVMEVRGRRGGVEGGGRRGGEGEEEHHHNPFIYSVINNPSSSKLQFRKETSRARWDEELEMGEVVEKKGSMWATTGIILNGKLYCHIEEILFLAERGALLLSGSDGTTLSIKDIYKKIAEGRDGLSWESFEAYRHLKLLGYIVGRHGIPWTVKSSNVSCCDSNSLRRSFDGRSNREMAETKPIIQLFKDMQLDELKPTFDVYLPNSKFRKSSPGDPSFLLCLLRENPPSRIQVERLEKNKCCNAIPLKYCFVDHGRVSFFSFDKVVLPVLP